MPTTLEYKRFWQKNNAVAPSKKNKVYYLPLPPPTEIIKLSTVNGSGIYLPPSPSDEHNRNEHYFDLNNKMQQQQENFHIPRCDKLTCCNDNSKRKLYTPSSLFI